MSLELEKSMRIVNDLVSFCYYEGAEDFTIRLQHHPDHSMHMQLCVPLPNLDTDILDKIRTVLSHPRQHEVEESFWELSGETEFSSELSLAGAMTDTAEVRYENDVLRFDLFRSK